MQDCSLFLVHLLILKFKYRSHGSWAEEVEIPGIESRPNSLCTFRVGQNISCLQLGIECKYKSKDGGSSLALKSVNLFSKDSIKPEIKILHLVQNFKFRIDFVML